MIKASIKMVGAFLMPKFRKGGAYGGKQNQGYHSRDWRRYHKASDSLKGCQYSEELFELFVDHIEVYSRQKIGFALHCGLILKEMI